MRTIRRTHGARWAVALLALLGAGAVLAACSPAAPGAADGTGPAPAGAPTPALADRPWPMHTIAGTWRGANGLGPGDVDGDGDVDYVTNYEFDQRYVLSLNPGPGSAQQRSQWPQVQVWPADGKAPFQGTGVNPENSILADVDGDGALDVVGAQGESLLEFWEGNSPGVRVIFGPGGAASLDPSKWVDAGRVPSTTTYGHFHWVSARDVNGDGVQDILAGGRRADTTRDYSGIIWLEAPTDPAQRRDLSRYRLHFIDPDQFSGHGFVFDDVDQDGDTDLVDANNDFDTPSTEESVYWYENPGPASAALRSPWTKHTMYVGDEFHTKPQIGVGDVDGNGLTDYATGVEDEILLFLKTAVTPEVTFDLLRIPKPEATRFLTRPVRILDVDGDGRNDIVGMMTHEDTVLPTEKAAVFWMEYSGDRPTAGNWTTHAIRWGSGKTALIPAFGEKWDNVDIRDVDGDGDPDIVANCEEWWMQQPLEVASYYDTNVDPSTVAVAWFENVEGEAAPAPAVETAGRVTLEAERPARVDDGQWQSRGRYPGWSGEGYLQAHNAMGPALDDTLPAADRGTNTIGPATFPAVHYPVTVDGGSYTVWVRRWVPERWGYLLGGASSDSAWLWADGNPSVVVDDRGLPYDTWSWQRAPAQLTLAPGTHDLQLRVRERGYAIDRIVLSSDPGWSPGPAT